MFFSHFSPRKPVCNENEHDVGYASDRFVSAIFADYALLLNENQL